jgi:hypothetical protein
MVSGVSVQVSGNSLIAWRMEGWEARTPEAMKPLSLQASKLSILPAIILTPDTRHLKPKLKRISNAKTNPCFGN